MTRLRTQRISPFHFCHSMTQREISSLRDRTIRIRLISVLSETPTILLTGKDTTGRFCLIDMHVPPGGGPPPHRHDFEESFVILEGEIEADFRGSKSLVVAGQTVHIPANAPHQFRNSSDRPVRLPCICAPAGQEEFFPSVGVPVATRTMAPAELDEKAHTDFRTRAQALAGKYKTEFLDKPER
jgi:quercetin dioxygenase-like cupin family protein